MYRTYVRYAGGHGTLTVELPTSADDWTGYHGDALDDRIRQLEVVLRRVEAAIVAASRG